MSSALYKLLQNMVQDPKTCNHKTKCVIHYWLNCFLNSWQQQKSGPILSSSHSPNNFKMMPF